MSSIATANVTIENDEEDCLDGWLSMDVTVLVNGERFKFAPSCAFSFDKTFTTSSGETCIAEAGMCSPFTPQGQFKVHCETSGSETIGILCPPERN